MTPRVNPSPPTSPPPSPPPSPTSASFPLPLPPRSLSLLPSPRSAYRRVFPRREASYSGNSRRSPGERESRSPQSRTGGPEGRSSVTLNPIRSSITISFHLLSVIFFFFLSLSLSPFPFAKGDQRSILSYLYIVSSRAYHRPPPIFFFLAFLPFFFFLFAPARARAAGLVALEEAFGLQQRGRSRLGLVLCAVNSSSTRAETFSVPCTCTTQDRDRGVERRRATNKVSFGVSQRV